MANIIYVIIIWTHTSMICKAYEGTQYLPPVLTLHFTKKKCIYQFHLILKINNDYIPEQHKRNNLCNSGVLRFLCGEN